MFILHLLFSFIFFCATSASNSCRFEHPTLGIIDLSSIGLQNNQARFVNLSASPYTNYVYSFNPCYSFSQNGCTNAAVCQYISQDSNIIATQNASRWSIDSNNAAVLKYDNGIQSVSITMVCSSIIDDQIDNIEDHIDYMSMRLYSRCACWNRCAFPSSSSTRAPDTTTSPTISFDSCVYQDSRFGTINLTSIGSTTGVAKYKDIHSIYDNYLWSYNPCYQFSEHKCHDVAACRLDKNRTISTPIGYQQAAFWINMHNLTSENPSIIYPSTSSDRFLTVELICDPSISTHHLNVGREVIYSRYQMQLRGPCACWNGCIHPDHHHRHHHNDDLQFWIIAGSIAAGVFVFCCLLISCLFCSKPRRHSTLKIIDEKTPFMHRSINSYEKI